MSRGNLFPLSSLLSPLNPKVLRQVDDLHVAGNGVLLQKLLALAVAEAEENDVHLFKGHVAAEAQEGVADESFVHIAHKVAGVAL